MNACIRMAVRLAGWVLGLMAVGLLTGCSAVATAPAVAPGPSIDTRYDATGQDSRALFLIIHFTAEDMASSVRILTRGNVSSHYLVSDETPPVIYRLVKEERRAWHAGDSFWKGHAMLNASSIGIEIVNPGPITLPDGSKGYAPYPDAQIDQVLALVRDIVQRHGISPERVLGHSDIAPQRKDDPGPLFPWRRLAEAGLLRWPDAQQVATELPRYAQSLPDAAWFQNALARFGYKVPNHGTWDDASRRVLAAFQMKYRPSRYDGQPDAECAALLQVLNGPAR